MKPSLFLALMIYLSATLGWAQGEVPLPNSVQAQVGDNYFGQSFGLTYSRDLLGPLWGQFALEIGSISFTSASGQTFFIFTNNTAIDYNVGLDIHDMVTTALAFHWTDRGTLRWLDSLAVGLTYFDLTVHTSYDTGNPGDPYQGQRDISAFALYTELHLLDFHVPNDRLFFSLGAKCNTAFLESPQTVYTKNRNGQTSSVSEINPNGGSILFPDIEGFLGLGYEFE